MVLNPKLKTRLQKKSWKNWIFSNINPLARMIRSQDMFLFVFEFVEEKYGLELVDVILQFARSTCPMEMFKYLTWPRCQ